MQECMKGSQAKARVLYAPVEEVGGEDRLLRACGILRTSIILLKYFWWFYTWSLSQGQLFSYKMNIIKNFAWWQLLEAARANIVHGLVTGCCLPWNVIAQMSGWSACICMEHSPFLFPWSVHLSLTFDLSNEWLCCNICQACFFLHLHY